MMVSDRRVQMKKHGGDLVFRDYIKVIEHDLQLLPTQYQSLITLKKNEVQLYDNQMANIIAPSATFNFLSVHNVFVTSRNTLKNGKFQGDEEADGWFPPPFEKGDTLYQVVFELARVKKGYWRTSVSYFDVAATIGGFTVVLYVCGLMLYKCCKSRNHSMAVYYMNSQYQVRTRKVMNR